MTYQIYRYRLEKMVVHLEPATINHYKNHYKQNTNICVLYVSPMCLLFDFEDIKNLREEKLAEAVLVIKDYAEWASALLFFG